MLQDFVFVFVAGVITALATGLGAVPFFFVEEFGDRWNVALWGIASGIMVSASLFGLINEGLAYAAGGLPTLMVGGLLAGIVLVEVSDRVLDETDVGGRSEADADTNDADTDESTGSLDAPIDVDKEDLRAQAAKYGLEDEVDALLRYLETHGEVADERLPEWDEFQELAADYGV